MRAVVRAVSIIVAIGAAAGCLRREPRPARTLPFDSGIVGAPRTPPSGAPPAQAAIASESFVAAGVVVQPAVANAGVADAAPPALAAARAGLPEDPRLDAIAAVAADAAARGYVISTAALRDATVAGLGSDVLPYVITARGEEADTDAQLAGALADLRAAAAIEAIGTGEARGVTGRVVALVATPPPTVAFTATRGADEVTVAFAWPWPTPPAAYLATDRRTRRIDVAPAGDGFVVRVRCPGGKPRGFATDAALAIDAGTRTVARVPSVCGGAPAPSEPFDVGPPARTAVEIEERLFALVNQTRVDEGRAPLAWDVDAHRMARDHAADMARGGFIGHVGSGGATLTDRVVSHALPATETFENAGRAGGPGEAHAAFLASPGHRANLLAAGARRGAIGVVLDPRAPGDFYVDEVFFEPGR